MVSECMDNMAMYRVPRPRRVLVLAPHPDDETVGCGGYLAMLADGGAEITVVFVTDGGLNASGRQDHALAERRRTESRAAVEVLGIRHVLRWGLPDGQLAECPCPTTSLRRLMRERHIEMVLVPHPGESHSDHAAVARFPAYVALAGQVEPMVMTYEIWTPQAPDCVVDVTSQMGRKLQALSRYESQGDRFNLDGLVEGLGRYRAAWSRMRGWRFAESFRRFNLDRYRLLCHED